jgi:hypothetical protein
MADFNIIHAFLFLLILTELAFMAFVQLRPME